MSLRVTDKRVGVLLGGLSSEREVSLASGAGVFEALEGLGYDCVAIDWQAGQNLAERITESGAEVIWNALHGTYGEDGAVQGLLKCLGILCTGAGITASALAMDKQIAKQIFEHHSVPTPRWTIAQNLTEAAALGFPCVVKPNADGSSVGVTIVKTEAALPEAFARATQSSTSVLVEEFIEGFEVTVGIIGDKVLGSIEIRAAAGFYDYQAKYKRGDTQYLSPPELPAEIVTAAEAAALASYRCLQINSYGRADLRINKAGQPFVLEVNTLPGMTKTSLLPKIAAAADVTYPTLCEQILELALVD